MISTAFFLAAAVEAMTLAGTFICLCGDDNASPEMWEDARKVFFLGTALAVGVASFHYVNW